MYNLKFHLLSVFLNVFERHTDWMAKEALLLSGKTTDVSDSPSAAYHVEIFRL